MLAYWKSGTTKAATITLPLYCVGETFDFSLTLVAESVMEDAYLCLSDSSFVGFLFAKRSTEGVYKGIMGFFDPTCYLGAFAEDDEVQIDFRIAFPSSHSGGLTYLPIILMHDDGASLPIPPAAWVEPDELMDFWVEPSTLPDVYVEPEEL